MFYVIGSGPSGVAAAAGLLDEGCSVTMLDVGVACEPERIEVARRLAATPRDLWSETDVASVRGPSYFAEPDRPLKRAYGSTFAYALEEMRHDEQHGTRCLQSFARGGLSNVWGAAVLPVRGSDLQDWPFPLQALEPSYAAVAQWMPIAGTDDDLSAGFPFYGRPQPGLRPSRQAKSLLERLASHREELRSAGVAFGESRLAVRSAPGSDGSSCQYTGLCLTGCPHFAIWTADQTLEQLLRKKGFTYRSGFRVDAVHSSDGDGTTIRGTRVDGQRESLLATRVLLACGPLATARIVLHSLGAYERPVMLRYQPYFLLPMLATRATDGVQSEALHTLAQLFVEINASDISPFTVHLQFYTFNSFVEERLQAALRVLGSSSALARRLLVSRMLIVQGYLHSAHARGIVLKARADGGGRTRLELRADSSSADADAVQRVVRMLRRRRKWFGATPIRRLMQMGKPGDGNHCGGSFPMRTSPGPFETDVLGQLPGLPGAHLVDSSVMPSLPATTFTYTVMANAHRIARAVARLPPA